VILWGAVGALRPLTPCFRLLKSPQVSGGLRMRLALMSLLLLLAGCVTEDVGVTAARMEAQDDASCQNLSVGKGEAAYRQCRQNLMGYRQQAQAQAQADNAARRQALANFGDALSAAGGAMRSNSVADDTPTAAPQTTHCTSTWSAGQRAQHPGDMTCTTN
jgi:hypothetical protein